MIERKFVDLYAQNAQGGLAVAERDVILTYALKILSDKRLLDKMVFKGGTCLRKNYFGKTTRFSLDLDFTNLGKRKPDDIILEVASIFNKTYYGIRFRTGTEDFYVSEDKFSCGATINYAHSWNEASFNFELSLREEPTLPTNKLPILPQSYLKHLEFKPPIISCFSLEELLAEKVRAAYQRIRASDVYDLIFISKKPFNRDLLRSMVVIKCWNVRDVFDPDLFLSKISTGKYNWSDLENLLRRGEKLKPDKIIKQCLQSYRFLKNLTADEKLLIQDARKHKQVALKKRLIKR